MKTVVITGASTGIGRATAEVLLEQGIQVVGGVRRQADADRLAAELGAHFHPALFDVTDAVAVRRAAERVGSRLDGRTLFGLVNNAGIAVPGPLLHLDVDSFRRQLEVNLTGQLIVTQAFAPLLGADRSRTGAPGRIVMMSSVGGRTGSPFIGAYNASKFGLEGFSESLRRELMLFGIDVIVVAPGAVHTPIWDKAEATDVSFLEGTPYAPAMNAARTMMLTTGRNGFPARRIGEAVLAALTAARPRTRYTVTPDPVRYFLGRVLPARLLDRIIARRIGLSRRP
jgi:NAD(P)-dependent dehydrogenase (short-subunit alcohol dehydrogenase family)